MQDAGRRLQIARSKLQAASWSGEGCCLEIDPGSSSSSSSNKGAESHRGFLVSGEAVLGSISSLPGFVAGQGKLQLAAPLYFSRAPPPPPPPRSANRLFVLGPASGSPEPGIHQQPQQPLHCFLVFCFPRPGFSLPAITTTPPGKRTTCPSWPPPWITWPSCSTPPWKPSIIAKASTSTGSRSPQNSTQGQQHHTAPPCGIQSHPAPILEHQPSLQAVQPANPCAPTAENALKEEAKKPKYSLSLLSIVNTAAQPLKTRLAAALAFKNFIRLNYVVRPIGRPAPCSFRS
jgi:hypothetical protein